ncbi:hypothetical protein FJU08_13380 [Martelella alba]|uniref:Glycosyl transferase family 2 n=1 Tax=Martelella alba TaxID=2590451 RepID=A0A506U8G8_9HYPH|nr:hypothetical protein [Martelella alba]TPW29788.1 hypothetical protein FJU08_13380 [Martelella alba]
MPNQALQEPPETPPITQDRPQELVIAGLARDCAHSLVTLLPKLTALSAQFARSHFIFLENSSVDDTRRILTQFAQVQQNCIFKTYPLVDARYWKRSDRVAHLRNRLMNLAEKTVTNPENAYYLQLDLDDVNAELDIDYIAQRIKSDDHSWAGLFPNQPGFYYDLWALRHPEYCPYDIWERIRRRPADMSREEAYKRFVTDNTLQLPRDKGLVEVWSAFGGLGIYRFTTIRGLRYRGLAADGREICEHVPFNAAVRERGGRLFIDCAMVNHWGPITHEPPHSPEQKKRSRRNKKLAHMLNAFFRVLRL